MKYHSQHPSSADAMAWSALAVDSSPLADVANGGGCARECSKCTVRHLSICSVLAPEEIRELEQATTFLSLPMGTTLVRAGEPRTHVFTLTRGALRLVRTLPDGRRQVQDFMLPGDYLGLSGRDDHCHDIEAIAESQVCRLPMAQMRELRQRYPHLDRKLLQRACQELDAAQDNALALARLQPPERLAGFLLRLAARQAMQGQAGNRATLPMGRGDIADHLGLTMETVSRTFTKLRQQGLIALPHLNMVEILDTDGLKALANSVV